MLYLVYYNENCSASAEPSVVFRNLNLEKESDIWPSSRAGGSDSTTQNLTNLFFSTEDNDSDGSYSKGSEYEKYGEEEKYEERRTHDKFSIGKNGISAERTKSKRGERKEVEGEYEKDYERKGANCCLIDDKLQFFFRE